MTIIDTLCATASCSSRAILARSSTTASRAATSRSRSASRALRSRSPADEQGHDHGADGQPEGRLVQDWPAGVPPGVQQVGEHREG
jgi:hypothetical protein